MPMLTAKDLDARLSGRIVPLRTPAAIESEIAELRLQLGANTAADDDVATRIDSDEFDAGIVRDRDMPRGRDGRLIARTSTLNASTATFVSAPETRSARAAKRAASKLCSACGLPATSSVPGLCRYHGPEGRG